MPAGGKRVTATLDIQAQVTNYQESLKKLQGAISSLHLPDGLKKGFDNLFIDYQKELEKLSKNSANNKLSILNEKEIEKSFDKIEGYYTSLVKKLRSSNYKESILEADFQAIEKMKEAQVDYSKAVKDSKKELDKEQDALDKLKAKLQEQKKEQKSLGSSKGGATTAQKNAQKAVESTTKALQEQKIVSKEATDQYKAQQKVTSSAQKEYQKALNAQAAAEQKLVDFRDKNKDKTDDKTKQRELDLIKAQETAIEKVKKAEQNLTAEKGKEAQLQQKANEEEAKREQLADKATEAKKREASATSSLNKTTTEYEKKAQEISQTEEQISQQTKNVDEKRQAYEKLAKDTLTEVISGLKKVAEAAGIDTSQIKSIEDVEKILEELSGEAKDKAAPAIKEVEEKTEQAGKAGEKASSGFKESADSLHEMAEREKEVHRLSESVLRFFSIDNAVRLFKRAIRSAYETITDLDKVMTETAVVTEFSVGDMWSQLPEYTKRANELGVSIHSAYEAATIYYQQGLKTNEVMQVSNQTLKMARIAGLDAAEATDRMTNALRGFNMEINEVNATRIADVYSKLAAISASNVDEISTAMTKVASLASNANMEFETTAAFLSQIIETTRESAETAGTALKTVVARFSEVKKLYSEGQLTGADEEGQEVDVNKVSTALRTAGINLNEYLSGAKGLDDIFIELASKWDSLDKVQQRYIATMAAGSRQQSRFIAMMSDYKRTQELVSAAQNANGASAEQYEKTLDSLQSKLAQLENAWNEFTMSITNSELVKFFVDAGTQILNTINAITGAFGDFGSGFSKVLLLIGGIKLGKTIFSKLIDSVVEQFVFAGQKSGDSFIKGFVKKTDLRNFRGFGKQAISELDKSIIDAAKKTESVPLVGQEGEALIPLKSEIPASALKPYAESIRRQIAEYVGNDATTGAKAINIFNAGIDGNGRATEVINGVNKELEKVGASLKVTKDMAHQAGSSLTSGFQTAAMAAGALSMVIGLLGTGLEKLGLEGASKTLGHISKGLGILTMMLTAMPALLNLVGAAASAAWASATLGISLVISLLITLISVISETYETQAKRAERLNEDIKKTQQSLEDSRKVLNEIQDSKDGLTTLQEEFSNLTTGTQEWRNKLIEVNQQVLELTNRYPTLLKYIERTSSGVLSISDAGWDSLIYNQQKSIQSISTANIGLKINQQSRNRDVSFYDTISKERGFGWANRAALDVADFIDSDWGWVASPVGKLVSLLGGGDVAHNWAASGATGISGELAQEHYYKIAEVAARQGVLARDTEDIRKIVQEIMPNSSIDSINMIVSKIGALGDAFDEFGLSLLQGSEAVQSYKNSLIETAITSDGILVGSKNNAQLSEAVNLALDFSDIEKLIEEESAKLPNKDDLKKLYAEEVGGYFENGKLYADSSMETEWDLSEETLKQSIATVRIQKNMQTFAKRIDSRLSSLQREQPKMADRIGRILTTEGQGLTREDLQHFQEQAAKGSISQEQRILQNWGLDERKNIDLAEATRQQVDSLLLNFDHAIQDEILKLGLSVGSEKNLAQNLLKVPLQNRNEILSAMTNFGQEMRGNGATNEQIASTYEYIASLDFSNASSIYSILDFLKELGLDTEKINVSDFTKELVDLTNATKEFSLENVINELKTTKDIIDSLFDGKRDFTEEQYLQAIKNGMDPEQFVKTVDGWRYIGKISDGVTQNIKGQQEEVNSMLLNLKQISELLNFDPSKAAPNMIKRKSGTIEFDGSNYVAPSASGYTEEDKTELQAEKDKAIKEITQTIQSLVSNGNIQGMLGVQESIFGIEDIETRTLLLKEFDKALIGIGKTYDDLYKYVRDLEDAETDEEKAQARLLLGLKVGAKQSEKEFKNLSSTIESSADALKYKDKDINAYNAAIAKIASAASIAFKDNENITTEFVENNIDLFKDYANGVEGAEDRIREALIRASNHSVEETNVINNALDYLRNNSDFQINGTADFSAIFNAFVALKGSAEKARAFIEKELGFSVNYEIEYEWVPFIDNGYGSVQRVVKGYKAVITDGFANQRRANTAAVAARDTGGKGGGGGSSKSDKPKNWKNPYDELYNLTEKINETTRQRNLLEAEYDLMLNDRTKANDVLLKNSYEQLKNLEKELALQKEMQAGRKRQLDNILNETYEDSEGNRKTYKQLGVEGYAHYDQNTQTIVIDWEGLEKLAATAGSEEKGKAVEDYIKRLEELSGQFEEIDSKVLEIEKQVQDIRMRGMDAYTEMQERVLAAFVKARQDQIDEFQALSDTIADSTSRVIDGIREQVEAERQARQNEKAEEDIADKEARLAYLQRDTSGANDLEIMKLNEELADSRQDYTDSLIDQGIEKMQEQADKAQDQRQRQIELMTAQLAFDQKTGVFNKAVETVLESALSGDKSTLGYIQTDLGTIEGWFIDNGEDTPKFVTKTGEVFDTALNGKGKIKIVDSNGNSYDFTSLGGIKTGIEGLKELLTGSENTDALTSEQRWKWESDLLTSIKEATEGWANFKMEMAKANGSVKAGGKNLTYKNNKWYDADGNEYEVTWNTKSGAFDAKKIKDAQKTTTTSGNNQQSGQGSGSGSGSGQGSGAGTGTGGKKKSGTTLKKATTYDDFNVTYSASDGYTMRTLEENRAKGASKLKSVYYDNINWENKQTSATIYGVTVTRTPKSGYTFATGGLADFTGPAWLDGSKTKPEIVLNPEDTQNFITLKDILSQLLRNPIQSGAQGAGGDNYYEINIDAEIANDYDVDRLASRIKQQIYSDSMYRNVNTLNWQR